MGNFLESGGKRSRLLQVFNQYLEPGGEELWVDQLPGLCEGLVEVDEVRFQSSTWMGRGAPTRLGQARRLWDNASSRDRLRSVVANLEPDVLLYHNLIPVASLGLYSEAVALGLPVVQYVHNFRPFSPSGTMWVNGRVNSSALSGNPWPEVVGRGWEQSFFKTFLIAGYQKRLLASGDLDVVKRWIAVSDFMRDLFVEAGLPAERVVSLRHCWKPSAVPDASKMAGHYLFLGRLVPEKGVMTLIRAWEILERRLGAACPRLVLAGSGPLEEKLHRIASKMRKVVCVGFVSGEPKRELLHGCRALVAPSIWWEPLGLIIYEAYEFGRPVLAAASGGMKETVLPGLTGFRHEPGDAEALAEDVERMESLSEEERIGMGMEGRSWLEAHASPSRWAERFRGIIDDAAGRA